jgi:Protein of unknown function (DUF3775)
LIYVIERTAHFLDWFRDAAAGLSNRTAKTAHQARDAKMLKSLKANQVHFIAMLARTARKQRDAVLGNVVEADLGGPPPARGAHNPVADIGLTSLASGTSLPADLAGAIAFLSIPARYELYILMRIGEGHLAAKNWERGLSEAEALGDEVTAAIVDDPDLHDHLEKGLYEISRP